MRTKEDLHRFCEKDTDHPKVNGLILFLSFVVAALIAMGIKSLLLA